MRLAPYSLPGLNVVQKEKTDPDADWAVLQALAYEWDFSDPDEIEESIRTRLAEKDLQRPPPERIERLRMFRREIEKEFQKYEESDFFTSEDRHPVERFDQQRLKEYFSEKYPDVSRRTIGAFVGFGLYLYYMR